MPKQIDDELYIPDEEMKMPESPRQLNSSPNVTGSHLLIIVGIAIGAALLVLAGLYAYDRFVPSSETAAEITSPSRPTPAENQEPESDTARAEVNTMQALSPSDQLPSIITDLENTRLDAIDTEINAIEDELR